MKLVDRQAVEGTTPTIYVGHRPYRDPRTGAEKVSRRWYAEYCREGRRCYEPLRTTNKNVAIRAAHEIINRIEAGLAKKPTRRAELEPLTKDYIVFLTNKSRAAKTLAKYAFVLVQLVGWAKLNGNLSATGFTEAEFWAFSKFMTDAGLAETTRYDRLIIVKQFFKWAAKAHRIPLNPVAGAELKEPESAVQPCFTPQQIAVLLQKAHPHERAIYATMAYAGLRFGEVRDLLWMDVLLDQGGHGFLVIRRGGSGETTKGRRVRRIPIHPELRKVFDRLPRDFDRVFTARPSLKFPDGGGPIDERRLLRSLKRLCRRAKFDNPDQYKLHTFRHAFASMCARNNVSYKYALEFMGHRSSDILDLYYCMFDETAEAAIATIDYRAVHAPRSAQPQPRKTRACASNETGMRAKRLAQDGGHASLADSEMAHGEA